MSENKHKIHKEICNIYSEVVDYFKKSGFIKDVGKGYDYYLLKYKGYYIKSNATNLYYGISFYGVKYDFGSIENYIANIKNAIELQKVA